MAEEVTMATDEGDRVVCCHGSKSTGGHRKMVAALGHILDSNPRGREKVGETKWNCLV